MHIKDASDLLRRVAVPNIEFPRLNAGEVTLATGEMHLTVGQILAAASACAQRAVSLRAEVSALQARALQAEQDASRYDAASVRALQLIEVSQALATFQFRKEAVACGWAEDRHNCIRKLPPTGTGLSQAQSRDAPSKRAIADDWEHACFIEGIHPFCSVFPELRTLRAK